MNNGNDFDLIYEKAIKDINLFEENFLKGIGNALKSTAGFASDVATGFKQGMEGNFFDFNKKIPTIGLKNPPKEGQIIISDKGNIKAEVISDIDDKDGQWDIEIKNDDPDKRNWLWYYQTTNPNHINGIITTEDYLLKTLQDDTQQQQQQQQQQQPPQPKDGDKVTVSSGVNEWKVDKKTGKGQWIMPNGSPNPAPGSVNNAWIKQQQAAQQQNNQQQVSVNRYKITYGPSSTCRVGFNTPYPNWYDAKQKLKDY
jgi:hypothetical protein